MKPSSLIFRHPRQATLLGLLAVSGLFSGCGNDYSNYTDPGSSGGSFHYSVGVYDSWGYYGNPYYGGGGTVIVTPPRPSNPRPTPLPAGRPQMRKGGKY